MPVRFRPINREVAGESDSSRARRIHDEQRLRREFIKRSQQASGNPDSTLGSIAKEIRDLPDKYVSATKKDDWLKVAQAAGRLERHARSLIAIKERSALLAKMIDSGMIE